MRRRTAHRIGLALMLALVVVETTACFRPRPIERAEERHEDNRDERQERRD